MDLPYGLVNLFERDVVLGQYVRYVQQLATPPNFAIRTDISHGHIAAIFQSRQFDWIGLGRGPIHFARDGSIQCFVRTLPVEFMSEPIEAALLRGEPTPPRVAIPPLDGGLPPAQES